MKLEIHHRPYLTEVLQNNGEQTVQHELDVWLYLDDEHQVGQVILELCFPSEDVCNKTIEKLVEAFKAVTIVREDL